MEKKILLILNLDETLIHASSEKLNTEPDFTCFNYFVYKRPFLKEFLNDVNLYFELAVWSSADDDYVQVVVDNIFPKGIKLSFVWGRSKCTPKVNLNIDEYGYYDFNNLAHMNYIKRLRKLKKLGFTMERMLIVDDTPHKCSENYGNAIYPDVFEGNLSDDELPLLQEYLKSLKDLNNVRYLEKRFCRNEINKMCK